MNSLNKITDKIISDANDRARIVIEEARGKCIALSNEYAEMTEREKADIKINIESEAALIIEKTKSEAEKERTDKMERAKKALLDEAFASARKTIEKLDNEGHAAFLLALAQKALAEAMENSDGDVYEVLLRKSDLATHGGFLYQRLCEICDEKYGTGKKIIVSNIPGKIDGGVMVKCGSVEVDYSLSAIFERLRGKLGDELCQCLFGNKTDVSEEE